jgi:hypothetical protein
MLVVNGFRYEYTNILCCWNTICKGSVESFNEGGSDRNEWMLIENEKEEQRMVGTREGPENQYKFLDIL